MVVIGPGLSVRGFIWCWQGIEATVILLLLAGRWSLTAALIGCLPVMVGLRFLMIGVIALFVSRLDPDYRLTPRQFWRYWNAEVLAFCRLYFWDQAKPRPQLGGGIAKQHVIFVHGFLCNDGFWQPLATRVMEHGFSVSGVEMREAFADIERLSSLVEAEISRVRLASAETQITLVAFSMGGLACRVLPDSLQQSMNLITLYTPHSGSYLAWLSQIVRAKNGRQMCPGSDWLNGLNQRRHHFCQWANVWSRHDTIVIPSTHARAESHGLGLIGRGHLSAAL